MGHFKLVYQSYPLDLLAEEPCITLRVSSGSWPGQELEDYVVLDLEVKSPKFFFDPNNDPEDDVSQRLNRGLDTQWLKIPLMSRDTILGLWPQYNPLRILRSNSASCS